MIAVGRLLTLPTEGGTVSLRLAETSPLPAQLLTGFISVNLEWEAGFRPDELEAISRLEGNDRRFRLIDADARSATLRRPAPIEPVKEDGKLVIRVMIPYREFRDFGA